MKTPWSVDAPRAPLYLVLIWTLHPALGWCGALTVTLMLALALAGLNERLNRRALILAAAGGAAVNGWRLDGAHQRALAEKDRQITGLQTAITDQNHAVETLGAATKAADDRHQLAEKFAASAIARAGSRGAAAAASKATDCDGVMREAWEGWK